MNICFPHRPGSGGPGSFQARFEKALLEQGWQVSYAGQCNHPDVIMVVGGTKRLRWLWKMKRSGVPIIYRLDGLAWLHRHKKVGIKQYLLAEFRNYSSKVIHAFLADHIIYQSQFVKEWWEQDGWRTPKDFSIIYNGVSIPKNLQPKNNLPDEKRLVILEGTVDYSPFAVDLLNTLASELPEDIAIEVYGRFENSNNQGRLHSRIQYFGSIPREQVFSVLQGSVYLSLDVNPACPNTVIEAMAVGAPVVAYGTGAIPELLGSDSKTLVEYGVDSWQLCKPDFGAVLTTIIDSFSNYTSLSNSFIQLYKENFSMDLMVNNYLSEIEKKIAK